MNSTPPPDGSHAEAGTQTAPPPPPGSGPRVSTEEMRDLGRLRRSLSDRKIAGVCGGIARHLDIDPLIVRVAMVVLVIFGGGGILLYGAAWLIIPDDSGDAVVRLDERSRSFALTIVGVIAALSVVGEALGRDFPWPLPAIGVVVIIVLLARGRHGAWHGHGWHGGWHGGPARPGAMPPEGGAEAGATYAGYEPPTTPPVGPLRRDPRKRGPILFGYAAALGALALCGVATLDLAGVDVPVSAYPAAVLATCGVMLIVGAFYGRGGGLILVGLLAALATLASSVVDGLDAGRVAAYPASAEAALGGDYTVDAGEVELDLTRITDPDELAELDGQTIDVEATFGHLVVIVPDEGLDVVANGTVDGGGEVIMFGDRFDGTADGTHDGGSGVPQLTIDARLLFGQIEFQTESEAA